MNVVIYARYSSHNQTEQSIEGQLKVCYEYAKKHKLTVINEYIDNALEITIDKDFNFTYNDDITDENWYDMDDLKQLADLLTGYEKDLEEFIEYNITNPLEVIEYINDFKANQELIYNEYAEDVE